MTFPPYHPFRSADARDRFLAFNDERAKRWPVPREDRFVDTSFGKTFVRTSGPVGAPPLVLLPGATSNSLMWIPLVRGLSNHFRIFAIDPIYEWGRSIFTKYPKNIVDLCTWLGESLDALGIGSDVHIAGASYGGWIAGEFALRRPERLRSAILVVPGGIVLSLDWRMILRLMSMLIPHPYLVKSYFDWVFADLVQQGEDGRKFVDEFARDTFFAKKCFPARIAPSPRVFTDAELASISVPVLCLMGENETCYSASNALARLQRVAPKIQAEVIKNAGHDLPFVHPNLVNEKIIAFAKRLS